MWLSDTLPDEERGRRSLKPSPRSAAAPLSMDARIPARPQSLPERVQAQSPEPTPKPTGGLERAAGLLRTALPFVQRFLPLVEGPLGAVVSSVLASHAAKPSAPTSLAAGNLAPIQKGLARLEEQHQTLCEQVATQNSSLRRVEDRLESVREATDRNTLEQQELMEDLKAVGRKVNVVTVILGGMLLVSILLNLVLYLHLERVLP
jgi:hypothetical protein